MKLYLKNKSKLFKLLITMNMVVTPSISWCEDLLTLKKSTQELIALNHQARFLSDKSQPFSHHALARAKVRHAMLMQHFNGDTKKIEKYLLDKSSTSRLSKEFANYVEKEIINLEGIIEIRAALYLKNKGEEIQYLLHTNDNKLYYLHIIGQVPAALTSGSRVVLKKAYSFSIANGFNNVVVSAEDFKITKQAVTTAIPDAFGSQKTIAILVNFQDQPNNQPWTKEVVSDMVFNNINKQYYEASYNQTTIVGSTVGWFTLPINSTTDCNTIANMIPSLAEQAVVKSGVDLSPYSRRIYLFPFTSSCGWAGLGNVGKVGAYSNAWINGYNDLRVITHELGHNVGLWHANRLQCTGASSNGNCTHVEYGDYADVMGWGSGTHFNAFQKERLGWLNYGTSPAINTVAISGDYTIAPFEFRGTTPETNVKALKILKSTQTDGSKNYYYLEFRQPLGYDAPLGSCGTSCDFTRGLLIHTGNSVNGNSSYILDPSPDTTNPAYIALLPGQVFKDPNAPNGGVTITTNSVSTSGASVSIRFGNTPPPTCVRSTATMTITPDSMQIVQPGEARSYVVTLTNRDSLGCAVSPYNLYVPTTSPNMIGFSSPSSIILEPGKTATINTWVWTNTNTPLGDYYFGVLSNNLSIPGGSYAAVTGGFHIH